MLSRGFFWLILLLVPIVSVVIDYVGLHTALTLFPSPIDIAIEVDRWVSSQSSYRAMRTTTTHLALFI